MGEAGQGMMSLKEHREQMKTIMDLIPDDVQLWVDLSKWNGERWPNLDPNKRDKNNHIQWNPKLITIKTKENVINIIGDYFSKGSQRARKISYKMHDHVSVAFNFPDGKAMVMQGRGKNRKLVSTAVARKPQVVRFESTGKVLTKGGTPVPASTMTAMQELGTLWVFRQVIQKNKNFKKWQDIKEDSDTWNELVHIWDYIGGVPGGPADKWLEIFFKQNKVFMAEMSDPKIKLLEEFNRGSTHAKKSYTLPGQNSSSETFMEFISNHVKQYGISQKDNWNPADIWLIKNEKHWRDALIQHSSIEGNRSPSSMSQNLQKCNEILRQAWAAHEIIGISLKAIGSGDNARWEAVNTTQEFINKRSELNFLLEHKLDGIKCNLDINEGITQDSVVTIKTTKSTYTFQVKANSSSDRSGSGLKYEGTQKGASAARLGKATVELVIDLMKSYKLSFDKDKTKYPITPEQLEKEQTKYQKLLKDIERYVSFSEKGNINAERAYDGLMYLMKREPWVANSKCQQISWLSEVLKLKGDDINKFLADLVFLSKKEGKRYGPFGKIY